ncbi:uncharacterized protein LOC126419329 [Schistocerca serialis cubense]|uniref:uncharacterized protein LOC126419329 n=1 Tax=Schistocerca serialis cubense TaxID=2023355 RepID=UPI00214DF6CF|nr:uncharacterized protein LOC126419329 [Schistocerca serialis cubense]
MATWNPNVPQTSQQELEGIKVLLESKLSDIQTELQQLRDTEDNNRLGRLPSENLKQTKKLLIQYLIERLTPQSPDFFRSGELMFKAVLEKLEIQLKQTTRMIDSEKRALNKLNKKLQSLQAQSESFDSITTTRHESGEMRQAENLDKIEKHLNSELQKHRKALKYVVDINYPGDQDMRRIITNLMQLYIDNPSEYIELSEEDHGRISRFFQIGMITRHPYDPMKVRLSY